MNQTDRRLLNAEACSWLVLLGMASLLTIMSCSDGGQPPDLNDKPCEDLKAAGDDAATVLDLSPESTETLNGMTRELCEGHLPAPGADCAKEALEQATAVVRDTGQVADASDEGLVQLQLCMEHWRLDCVSECARRAAETWIVCVEEPGEPEEGECEARTDAAAQECNLGCPSACKLACLESVQPVVRSCLDAGGAVDECLGSLRQKTQECTDTCAPDPYAVHPENGQRSFEVTLLDGTKVTLHVTTEVQQPFNFYIAPAPEGTVPESSTFTPLHSPFYFGAGADLGDGAMMQIEVPGVRAGDRMIIYDPNDGIYDMLEPGESGSGVGGRIPRDKLGSDFDFLLLYGAVRPTTPVGNISLEGLPGAFGTSDGKVVARRVDNVPSVEQAIAALRSPANGTTYLIDNIQWTDARPGSHPNYFPTFAEPFPGGSGDNFAVLQTATLNVPERGRWYIRVDGDDNFVHQWPGCVLEWVSGPGRIVGVDTIAHTTGGCANDTVYCVSLIEGPQPVRFLHHQFGAALHQTILAAFGEPEEWRPLGHVPTGGSELLLEARGDYHVQVYKPDPPIALSSIDHACDLFEGGAVRLLGEGNVPQLWIRDADYRCGAGATLPGTDPNALDEHFISVSTGRVHAPVAATYTVTVRVDDACKLKIVNSVITIVSGGSGQAENDGVDAVKVNSASRDTVLDVLLPQGDHSVELLHVEKTDVGMAQIVVGTGALERTMGDRGGQVQDDAPSLPSAGDGVFVDKEQGGNVTHPDRVLMGFPPKALRRDAAISITRQPPLAGPVRIGMNTVQALGNVYNLQPTGTSFNAPVSIDFFDVDTSALSARQTSEIGLAKLLGTGQATLAEGPTTVVQTGAGVAQVFSFLGSFSTYALVYPADTDRDGVFDSYAGEVDECPSSDLRPTISIRLCDVPNTLDAQGCTISDRIRRGGNYGHLCREVCGDGDDNDNDQLADCDDPDCAAERVCQPCGLSIAGPSSAASGGDVDLEADHGGLGPLATWSWSIESGAGLIEGPANAPAARVRCAGEGAVVVRLVAADAACGSLGTTHTVACAPCNEAADSVAISGPASLHQGAQGTLTAVTGGADAGATATFSWQAVSGPAEVVGSASEASATVRCLTPGEALVEVAFDDGACGNVTRATHALTCLAPAGGAQLPGDCNQDGALDIADPICFLGFLFLGVPSQLPCAGAAEGPANLALVDANGDRRLDLTDGIYLLSYLFGGCAVQCPPHVGGTECLAIEDCPEVCRDSP